MKRSQFSPNTTIRMLPSFLQLTREFRAHNQSRYGTLAGITSELATSGVRGNHRPLSPGCIVGYPSLCPAQLGTPSLRMFQYQTISFTGLQSVLLRHRGDDTVHPQVLYKLPVVVCDVPNGND